MANKQMEQQLKTIIESFLSNIKIEQKYLIQSQLDLNHILDQCVIKAQNIAQSSFVTQQKCDIINEKLARIPKLQARMQLLSKIFYDAHKKIQVINKNLSNLQKMEQIIAQHEGRTIQNRDNDKITGYDVGLQLKRTSSEQKSQKQRQKQSNTKE